MRELDKLAKYLHEIKMPFMQYECNKKFDERDLIFTLDRHQICVPDQDTPVWDVICQYGSYGYEEGLLEAYGAIVDEEEDGSHHRDAGHQRQLRLGDARQVAERPEHHGSHLRVFGEVLHHRGTCREQGG